MDLRDESPREASRDEADLARFGYKQDQHGFTLIEMLVVIIILGVLAAVVILAVGGLNNSSQTSACNTEKKTIQTAQEAYFATNTTYAVDTAALVPKFLAETPTLYSTAGTPAGGPFTGYTITAVAGNPDGCS